MAPLSIEFGATPRERLEPLGLRLPTLTGTCQLDAGSSFEPPCFIQARVDQPTLLEVGAFTSVSGGQIGKVKIGRYCAIAPDVRIGAHEHPTHWLTCSRVAYYPVVHDWDRFSRPDGYETIRQTQHEFTATCPLTTLGPDVWIGQGAFIKAGVTLGAGAVVAARSVVIKDVPPYAIVAGMPASIKKYRFDERIIARLLEVDWWRYSLYDCYDLPFDKPEQALDQIEERVAAGTLKPYCPRPLTAVDLQQLFAAHA